MSKAPRETAEKASARSISPNISVDRRTGCAAARRLMRESSESALCGLIARSMRCISAITASIAAWPAASSSAHSSTVMAVPMMASSRLNQPAWRDERTLRLPHQGGAARSERGDGVHLSALRQALRASKQARREPSSRTGPTWASIQRANLQRLMCTDCVELCANGVAITCCRRTVRDRWNCARRRAPYVYANASGVRRW